MSEHKNRPSSPNYGGYWGHRIFQIVISFSGVVPAYILLLFVAPYYVLCRPAARRSASFYLRKRFPGDNRFLIFLRTFKYFYIFGQTLVDQAVAGILGEECIDFEFPDGEKLLRKINDRKGVILLTSHLGNWHIAMGTMGEFGYSVHFHFQLEEHTEGRHFFHLTDKRGKFKIISPTGFLGGMVEITNVLESGGCVAIMGDRAWGAKTARMKFLGAEAVFPISPYYLASITGAEIFMLLPVRTGKLSFRIDTVEITRGLDLKAMPRDAAVNTLLACYVENIEKCLESHPYMWFNFFNIWDPVHDSANSLAPPLKSNPFKQ